MKRRILVIALVLVAVIALAGYGLPLALSKTNAAADPTPTAQAVTAPAVTTSNVTLAAMEGALESIYTAVNPSVVRIDVVQQQAASAQGLPFFGQQPNSPSQQFAQATGSGFVWDKQGHIVTNNHVVDGADTISVIFYDGTTVSAKVVGRDPDSDLAVVQVDVPADQLHPVTLADSTKVKVGQIAIAIGNPFGEQNTMTTGIISALGRTLPSTASNQTGPSYTIPDVIQTDAPINPGNSGGVLLDANGQVIGVTAAIESSVNSSAGIGFAIPSAIVEKVVPSLISTGTFQHSWLGISGTSLTPDLATAMNLKADQRGALVADVTSNSPAAKAGLKGSTTNATILGQQVQVGGDVIVAIDSKPVKTFEDIIAYLASATSAGQSVTLTILRDGKEQTVKVTLEVRPTSTQPATGQVAPQNQPPQGQGQSQAGSAYLGLAGVALAPDIAAQMQLPTGQQGVLVQQVVSGSPADTAGLKGSFKPVTINGQTVMVGGDVITALGRRPVTTMEGLQALVQQLRSGQTVSLTVLRDGKEMQVSVTLGTRPTTTQ